MTAQQYMKMQGLHQALQLGQISPYDYAKRMNQLQMQGGQAEAPAGRP